MVESFPPAVPAAASAEPLSARRVPLWAAVLLTLGAAALAALGTRAWLLRDFPPSQAAIHGMLADEQVPIELAPTAPALADALIALVAPLRQRLEQLRREPTELDRILAAGAERAAAIGNPVLARAKSAVGLTL